MRLFLTVYGLTFLAELPDKTLFATVLLASRRSHLAVWLGASAAFAVHCAVAVAFGRAFALLPLPLVRVAAAALFAGVAVKLAFFEQDDDSHDAAGSAPTGRFWQDARAAFAVIVIAEWGDLTQLSTATFAARYRAPATVFAAATLALGTIAGLAAALGDRLGRRLHPQALRRVSATAFALVAAVLLADALRR